MIRKFKEPDLPAVMQIWLDGNTEAHHFISESYWTGNFETVQSLLPEAEVYVCEDDRTTEVQGFIGLTGHYVAGMFVKREARSQGIGKMLLDHVKAVKTELMLTAYQKNTRAVCFYQRERFSVDAETVDENTGEKEFVLTWKQ